MADFVGGGGWQGHFDYLLAIGPLLGLLAAVPTVEEISRGELLWIRPVLAGPLEFRQHFDDIVLSDRALKEGRWWTLLSHVFLHQDFRHLASNAQVLALNGLSAFRDWGAQGLYGVFFCSAAVSAMNRWGREQQTRSQIEGSIPRAPERLGPLAVPDGARDIWDSLRRGTASLSSSLVSNRASAFGASGGACGLVGYGVGTTLIWLGRLWFEDDARQRRRHADSDGATAAAVLAKLAGIVQGGLFVLEEWRSARGDRGLTNVDHSGHLTGFGVGVGLALLSAALRAPPPTSPPRSGGRAYDGRQDGGRSFGSGRRYVDANGNLVGR